MIDQPTLTLDCLGQEDFYLQGLGKWWGFISFLKTNLGKLRVNNVRKVPLLRPSQSLYCPTVYCESSERAWNVLWSPYDPEPWEYLSSTQRAGVLGSILRPQRSTEFTHMLEAIRLFNLPLPYHHPTGQEDNRELLGACVPSVLRWRRSQGAAQAQWAFFNWR